MSSFKIISGNKNNNKKEKINEGRVENSTFKLTHDLDVTVIRLCKCIQAPNGDFGLFGYIQTKQYKVQYMGKGKNGKPYVRLYKNYDIDSDTNEYDTITVFNYQYYFKTFGIDESRGKPEARSKRK